jgi:hypothetical protein
MCVWVWWRERERERENVTRIVTRAIEAVSLCHGKREREMRRSEEGVTNVSQREIDREREVEMKRLIEERERDCLVDQSKISVSFSFPSIPYTAPDSDQQ